MCGGSGVWVCWCGGCVVQRVGVGGDEVECGGGLGQDGGGVTEGWGDLDGIG